MAPVRFSQLFWTFFLLFHCSCAKDRPEGFPSSINLEVAAFQNWGQDQHVDSVWCATPQTPNDILLVANWARTSSYKIRASGFQHTWSPITVSKMDTIENEIPRVILLKMAPHLNKVGIISNKSGDSSFWAETGVTMENLTQILEDHNLAFSHIPATGQISLGGVLAIDGHGAAVEAYRAKPPVVKQKGHSYGTLSNLILSFTALVYDKDEDAYVFKYFDRSHPQAKYFLVSLGRTILTNVTMRIGPLFLVETSSDFDVPASDLFRPPRINETLPNPEPLNTRFSEMLEFSGRFEAIVFPYSNFAWAKTWYVRAKNEMSGGYRNTPYNYQFSDNWPHEVQETVAQIRNGEYQRASYLGSQMYQAAVRNMSITKGPVTIWGTAKNMLLYIRPSTLKATANGYAILIQRKNVQDFVSRFYTNYQELGLQFEAQGKYPFNGPLELRASGLENAQDVAIEGSEAPCISAAMRVNEKSQFDTVIWLNVLSLAKTPYMYEALQKLEEMLVNMKGQFLVRPEWSKGWAYTEKGAWTKKEFINKLVRSTNQSQDSCWDDTVRTLTSYDPFRVISNAFLDEFM